MQHTSSSCKEPGQSLLTAPTFGGPKGQSQTQLGVKVDVVLDVVLVVDEVVSDVVVAIDVVGVVPPSPDSVSVD